MVLNSSRFSNLTILGLAISHQFVYHLGLSSSYVSTTLFTSKNCARTTNMIAAGNDAQNLTMTAFDEFRQIVYKEAIKPHLINRNKFSLEGWKRVTGGLDDADRKASGDLYYSASSVFEYGLGESTLIAAHTGVPRYADVDSDAKWAAQAREKSKLNHFRFNFADISETGLFGNPLDESFQKIQYDYQLAPLVLEDEPFDVYLVDGRYRVACACVSFLHAMKTRVETWNWFELVFMTMLKLGEVMAS